jgi:hypothetical protein
VILEGFLSAELLRNLAADYFGGVWDKIWFGGGLLMDNILEADFLWADVH